MADFISQLSGPEMDNALQEVNAHNAEAWSSGTRDGVQVASGDPTYNNNAAYWARRAESAVPVGSESAVLWSKEQQLAESDKARARNNIGAEQEGAVRDVQIGGVSVVTNKIANVPLSNPNLLDNGRFQIDQRQGYIVPSGVAYYIPGGAKVGDTEQVYKVDYIASSGYVHITINGTDYVTAPGTAVRGYATSGYTVDRWSQRSTTAVEVVDNGIIFYNKTPSTQQNTWFAQKSSLGTYPMGVVTITALVNGVYHSWTVELDGTNKSSPIWDDNFRISFEYTSDFVNFLMWSMNNSSTRYHVEEVIIEEGSISTLANATPPNKDLELVKCQTKLWVANPNHTQYAFVALALGQFNDRVAIVVNAPTTLDFKAGGYSIVQPNSVSSIKLRGVFADDVYKTVPITSIAIDQASVAGNNIGLTFTIATNVVRGRVYELYVDSYDNFGVSAEL